MVLLCFNNFAQIAFFILNFNVKTIEWTNVTFKKYQRMFILKWKERTPFSSASQPTIIPTVLLKHMTFKLFSEGWVITVYKANRRSSGQEEIPRQKRTWHREKQIMVLTTVLTQQWNLGKKDEGMEEGKAPGLFMISF